MQIVEKSANNGQLVSAMEIDDSTFLVYSFTGLNPDAREYQVVVWREEEPTLDSTLEEAAPLHLEFAESFQDAEERMEQVLDLINEGVFAYDPPKLPA